MNVWFTSDTHFGHKRIIELAKRPFSSVEQMDGVMIESWNARVRPGDLVYHVGDFAFADHTPYLERLNGQKFLVKGNSRPLEAGEEGERLAGRRGSDARHAP